MTATALLKLQRAGFTEAQVEALAEYLDTQAATKLDLAEMEARLTQRIEAVDRRLDGVAASLSQRIDAVEATLARRMDGLENRIDRLGLQLTVRLGGMTVVGIGVVAVLVKLL